MAGRSSPKAKSILTRAQTAAPESPKLGICYKCAGRTKHICKNCGKKACDKHSQKRKIQGLDVMRRICDECSEVQLKHEGKSELEQEIAQMKLDLERALLERDQLDKRIEETKNTRQQLSNQIDKVKELRSASENELQGRLEEETRKDGEIRKEIDKLQMKLDEINSEERKLNEECGRIEQELEGLRREELQLREEKTNLMRTLQDIDMKEKSSIPLSHLRALACDVCRRRLDMTYRPRSSQLQARPLTSSVTSLPRPSPPVHPPDKKKDCCLM